MTGFIDFIRKQGVVGLAVGFILGGAVSKLVAALVEDVINPIVGVLLGKAGGLASATFSLAGVTFKWGHFVSAVLDFVIIAAVVYYGFKFLKLDQLDKKE